MYFLCNFFIK